MFHVPSLMLDISQVSHFCHRQERKPHSPRKLYYTLHGLKGHTKILKGPLYFLLCSYFSKIIRLFTHSKMEKHCQFFQTSNTGVEQSCKFFACQDISLFWLDTFLRRKVHILDILVGYILRIKVHIYIRYFSRRTGFLIKTCLEVKCA